MELALCGNPKDDMRLFNRSVWSSYRRHVCLPLLDRLEELVGSDNETVGAVLGLINDADEKAADDFLEAETLVTMAREIAGLIPAGSVAFRLAHGNSRPVSSGEPPYVEPQLGDKLDIKAELKKWRRINRVERERKIHECKLGSIAPEHRAACREAFERSLRPLVTPKPEPTPKSTGRVGDILRRQYAKEILRAAKHEAAHALMAASLGVGVRSVMVGVKGDGLTIYRDVAQNEKRLMCSLAGLTFNEGCGHGIYGVEGEGGDLEHICAIVREMTGRECTEENVLNDQLVDQYRAEVDRFLSENSSVIGELAQILSDHSNEEISGDVVAELWRTHQEKRRLRESNV